MNRWVALLMALLIAACAAHPRHMATAAAVQALPPPLMPVEMSPPPPPPPPPPPVEHFDRSVLESAGPVQAPRAPRTAAHARSAPSSELPFTDPQPPGEGPPDADVQEGVGAFVKPPPMQVDHWYVIEFAAGPTEQKIRAETEGQYLTAPTQIYVGKWMRVTLLDDPAFEIKRKSPTDGKGEQETGLDKTATWLWDVRPKAGGPHSLQAEVEVLEKNADGSFERIDGYTRKVDVTVKVGALRNTLGAIDQASSIGDKLTGLFNSWQKAVTALVALIAAFALLAWRLGLRKTKPD